MKRVRGSFAVRITPQTPDAFADGATLGRMTIEKQFHGDLVATSKGQMLTAMTAEKGSAGYVAIERVTGKLHGRSGAFTLQHFGSMNRGRPDLKVVVVADSGTEELVGLSGTMTIIVADGKHSYDFEYSLP
jgi:hypothetical protein